MCVGIPLRIVSTEGGMAFCADGDRRELVDLALVPEASEGDEILVSMGLARRLLDAAEAANIRAALHSLATLEAGSSGHEAAWLGFADLLARPPSLPPHLEAARAAGRKEG